MSVSDASGPTMIGLATPAKSQFVQTANIGAATAMARSVLAARSDARIGQIIGMPGTGKSDAGRHIAREFGAVRVCAWANMGRRALLAEIGTALGIVGTYGADDLTARILKHCPGQLIIVDEANHLRWNVIEAVRIFVDEGLAGLILIGTDLLKRKFHSAKTEIYLAQMSQRIGAKRVTFEPMRSAQEVVFDLQRGGQPLTLAVSLGPGSG